MVRSPAGVNGWPRFGPLATSNKRGLEDSGRSVSRYVWIRPATSTSSGTRRSLAPLPSTRIHRAPMSISVTSRVSISPDRKPGSNLRPAIDRSHHVRRLESRSAVSRRSRDRGSRRGSRRRRADRRFGRTRWLSRPLRSSALTLRASRPLGIGLRRSGSRSARKVNSPVRAASRWLMVVAEYRSRRLPVIDNTFAGRPSIEVSRQCRMKSNTVPVVTDSRSQLRDSSQRQNARRSYP